MRLQFLRQHRIEVDNQTSIIYPQGLITSDLSDQIAAEAIDAGAAVDLDAAPKAPVEPTPVEKKPATKSKK